MKKLTKTQSRRLVEELVFHNDNEALTTSLLIAEKFEKRHADVIRAIQKTECSEAFAERNFALSEYLDSTGRKLPMYLLTEKGFSKLVMGFTGKKAAEWQERFIEAFFSMRDYLNRESIRISVNHQNPLWMAEREALKLLRKDVTDEIKDLVADAKAAGSSSAHMLYTNYTVLAYSIFKVEDGVLHGVRERLDRRQIQFLSVCETIILTEVHALREAGTHYKEIYQIVKKKVQAYCEAIGGKMVVPQLNQALPFEERKALPA